MRKIKESRGPGDTYVKTFVHVVFVLCIGAERLSVRCVQSRITAPSIKFAMPVVLTTIIFTHVFVELRRRCVCSSSTKKQDTLVAHTQSTGSTLKESFRRHPSLSLSSKKTS